MTREPDRNPMPSMVHLSKPPSQFKNLFWNFRVVGVVVFLLIHLLLYLLRVTGGSFTQSGSGVSLQLLISAKDHRRLFWYDLERAQSI